jgi:hypothetical protein
MSSVTTIVSLGLYLGIGLGLCLSVARRWPQEWRAFAKDDGLEAVSYLVLF